MSLLKLKAIEHTERTGKESGKKYTSCKLTVLDKNTNKDTFISGYGNSITKTWNAGDSVDVTLSRTDKGYWNFGMNENSKPSENPVVVLLREISAKLDYLCPVSPATKPTENEEGLKEDIKNDEQTTDTPNSEEIRVEDIPF